MKIQLGVLTGLIMACMTVQAAPLYSVMGYGSGQALSVNRHGQVAGMLFQAQGSSGFVAQGDQLQVLGTLGGPNSTAVGINDQGLLVGNSTLSNGAHRGYILQNGQITDLGTLGGNMSIANGINNLGQVVGVSIDQRNAARGFIWQNGVMVGIETSGNYFEPNAINDLGAVVGGGVVGGVWGPHLWQAGQLTGLGSLGGDWGNAYAINNAGQIVGASTLADRNTHAFLWQSGVMTDLGTLGGHYSAAYGINGQGQAVGIATRSDGGSAAFLYEGGRMFDVNELLSPQSSGWRIHSAFSINASGQIAGLGCFNGQCQAVLLSAQPTQVPVPAPVPLLLLGAGLLLLAGRAPRAS